MSILVINPNSTVRMTEAVQVAIKEVSNAPFAFYTSNSGPASIDDADSCHESAAAVLSALSTCDHRLLYPSITSAILVACYSVHPLVAVLPQHFAGPVVGIFEASIAACLLLFRPAQRFGIVTTGAVWERLLTEGVGQCLGVPGGGARFAGVATTGLSAVELHIAAPDEVRSRMVEATRQLVRKGDVGAVCLGCAGMVGMDEWVREGCVQELGEEGKKVKIVDSVKVAAALLDSILKGA